ncbi:MAG: hypothetical protein V5B40_08310 [Candidatus Accumulibacter meliphilus]
MIVELDAGYFDGGRQLAELAEQGGHRRQQQFFHHLMPPCH